MPFQPHYLDGLGFCYKQEGRLHDGRICIQVKVVTIVYEGLLPAEDLADFEDAVSNLAVDSRVV
ncbi:unnamed protein product [Dibothriocephalus latus]|uniref:Uncharacterized protein n=1 Tax=Dibothriocephalus latus TaxID=60516 RepID=A0A3P6PAX9_DIBLA|nr:unnamed protein product [Dibothriocephalus latus]